MRLIDADALIKEAGKLWSEMPDGEELSKELMKAINHAPTIGGWISVKEVANIIADLFGDGCACNSNDIDEWLPRYCEYRDTDCPHPPGVACWEQYLKHLDKKPNGGG